MAAQYKDNKDSGNMGYNKRGYYDRARRMREITEQYYEPENHRKCKKAIWRTHIRPIYGVCYQTYINSLRALRTLEAEQSQTEKSSLR